VGHERPYSEHAAQSALASALQALYHSQALQEQPTTHGEAANEHVLYRRAVGNIAFALAPEKNRELIF
jgi:hypothetical protein